MMTPPQEQLVFTFINAGIEVDSYQDGSTYTRTFTFTYPQLAAFMNALETKVRNENHYKLQDTLDSLALYHQEDEMSDRAYQNLEAMIYKLAFPKEEKKYYANN